MNIAELAQLTELHQLQHEYSLLELLDALRVIDPGVADQAIHVFDDRTDGGAWLTNPVQIPGRRHAPARPSPGRARGRAARPLRVFYGVYSVLLDRSRGACKGLAMYPGMNGNLG